MKTGFPSRIVGDVKVFEAEGKLTSGTKMDGFIETVIGPLSQTSPAWRKFVLNLRFARKIDGSGIRALEELETRVTACGGQLKICCVPEGLGTPRLLLHLNLKFEVHDDEPACIRSFP
ncbi:MAG: hypothetical protein AAB871_00975 [Patescibacteria group bacterium]